VRDLVVDRAPAPFDRLPALHYRTLAIDPPWHYVMGTKGRPQHYRRMRDPEIAALPIGALAHPDGCNVFLWITAPKMPAALAIGAAWGARYSSRAFVWIKTHPTTDAAIDAPELVDETDLAMSMGYGTRKNAEDVLWLKFGRPPRLCFDVREVIVAPRRENSRKPDEFYRRVERLSAWPYCDVFSREARPGWDAFGDEADKFDPVRGWR
jgi:N6-adenosine-specific RNA methylase IME4